MARMMTAGSTPVTPVSRDPRLRLRQPSHAEEPAEEPESEEEEYELSSDEEEEGEGGPAEEEHPTSQYRGVSWDKKNLQWEVRMSAAKAGKNKIRLGNFDFEDEEDAARLYDRGQIAYRGRKAYAEAYEAGRRKASSKQTDKAYPNFPLEQYFHELDWLEGLGVVDFAALLKKARAQLKAADKQVTPEATLEVVKAWQGQPSSPGPQQHGASDTAADEEIKISQLASPTAEDEDEIRKLAREGTPPRPAAGQASRPKRSRPAPRDTPEAKRRKPAAAPAAAPAAIAELRRDVREAELKTKAVVEKSAGLASFNASLLASNAQKDKQLQALLANNASLLASNAQKDKQLQALHERLDTQQEKLIARQEKLHAQQEKLIAHLLADSPDLSREGAE